MNKYIISTLLSAVLTATAATQTAQAAVVKDNESAIDSLKTLPNSENAKAIFHKYSVHNQTTDSLGFTHYTLIPKVKGKIVDESEIKVHVNPQRKIIMINGATDAKVQTPSNSMQLSKAQALSKAFGSIGIKQSDVKTSQVKL